MACVCVCVCIRPRHFINSLAHPLNLIVRPPPPFPVMQLLPLTVPQVHIFLIFQSSFCLYFFIITKLYPNTTYIPCYSIQYSMYSYNTHYTVQALHLHCTFSFVIYLSTLLYCIMLCTTSTCFTSFCFLLLTFYCLSVSYHCLPPVFLIILLLPLPLYLISVCCSC